MYLYIKLLWAQKCLFYCKSDIKLETQLNFDHGQGHLQVDSISYYSLAKLGSNGYIFGAPPVFWTGSRLSYWSFVIVYRKQPRDEYNTSVREIIYVICRYSDGHICVLRKSSEQL